MGATVADLLHGRVGNVGLSKRRGMDRVAVSIEKKTVRLTFTSVGATGLPRPFRQPKVSGRSIFSLSYSAQSNHPSTDSKRAAGREKIICTISFAAARQFVAHFT